MKVKKIDLHLHLATRPGTKMPTGEEMPTAQAMIQIYNVLGIERGVLLPGPGEKMMGIEMMTSEDACDACKKYPDRFSWFCNFVPQGTEKDRETLLHYKEMGAKGLGEFTTNLRLDDPKVENVLKYCQELELPFLFHMSPEEHNYYGVVDFPGLPLLEGVLKKFPHLKVLGHSQPFWQEISTYQDTDPAFRNRYPSGPVTEGVLQRLFRQYPNLYGDLSADSGGNALMRDPDYGVKFMEEFQDRLFFATDTLIFPLGAWLDSLSHQEKLSDDAYFKICRGNAVKLLGL